LKLKFQNFKSGNVSTEEKIGKIISQAVERQGGNKSEIGRQIGYSSQLLGQYTRGEKEPKMAFFVQWKRTFGEDLYQEIETKVYEVAAEGATERKFLEASLTSLLEGQNEIRAQLKTIHQWDAQVYAQGEQEREKEAVEHIGKLYASNLLEYQKRGIRPLVGKDGITIP